MTITFDVLDRFQENKVLQTAQTMNNVSKLNAKDIENKHLLTLLNEIDFKITLCTAVTSS